MILIKPIAILCLAVCCFNKINAQNDQDAMMKAWTAYMTPGDIHKMMAKGDGDWVTEVSVWMQPNAQPVVAKGTCSNKMILGGRYQQSEYKGDFMGMKMEGIGTMAYDNSKKEFLTTWIDNMGTGIMNLSGKWDDATKTINFAGNETDPMTGKDMAVRETYQIVDDTHHVMQMFMKGADGTEFKSMEIKFARK